MKARKHCQTTPNLSELLGRLSYEKKEYPRAIQLLQEGAGNEHSTPILFFIWECLSFKSDKKPRRKEP